jgi:hypothetical protein
MEDSRVGSSDQDHDDDLNRFESTEDDFWIHDQVRSEELPGIATAGLMAGLDSPSLRVLAGQPSHASRDNMDLWIAALEELDRTPQGIAKAEAALGAIGDDLQHA